MRIIDLNCLSEFLNSDEARKSLSKLVPGDVLRVKVLVYELPEKDPSGIPILEEDEYNVYEVLVQLEYVNILGKVDTMEYSLKRVLMNLDGAVLSKLLDTGCVELL